MANKKPKISAELQAKINEFRAQESARDYAGWSPGRTEAMPIIEELVKIIEQ